MGTTVCLLLSLLLGFKSEELICEVHHDVIGYAVFTGPGDVSGNASGGVHQWRSDIGNHRKFTRPISWDELTGKDEITRQPILENGSKGSSEVDSKQTSLTSFFSPTKPRPVVPKRAHKIEISDSKTRASGTLPRESDTTAGQLQVMLYKELFDAMIQPDDSDSTTSGSNVTMSFERVFNHLGLDPTVPFSEAFIKQSRPIVSGNMLQFDTGSARNLGDMVEVWRRYVGALGLGPGGRSEDQLELVYRRAGGRKKGKGKGSGGRKRKAVTNLSNTVDVDDSEERELQLAIELSLQTSTGPEVAEASLTSELAIMTATDEVVSSSGTLRDTSILVDDGPSSQKVTSMESTGQVIEEDVSSLPISNPTPVAAIEAEAYLHPSNPPPMTEEEREREEDAIALEVELSYRATGEIQDPGEMIPIRASQDPTPANHVMDVDMGMIEESQSDPEDTKSGGIIGRHRFKYDSGLLRRHLEGVMSYWHGIRQPSGVDINNTRRCGWCEFEDGCEWRLVDRVSIGGRC